MIAFTHYGAKEDISGVTSWLRGLLADLRGQGEEVALNLHHFGKNPQEGNLYHEALALGVAVSGLPSPGTTEAAVIDTLEYLNREKPAVFLPQVLPACHYAARIAREQGLPWVFTIHSDDPEYWALADHSAPDAAQGICVAVSETIGREARARYPQADVRVIPYGVRIPEQAARWTTDRFRVVYSGRLVEEQKRISKVLDVMIAACRQTPRIEAVLLGDGAAREELEARVRTAGLAGRIRFAGRLTGEEVGRELMEAQAILLMSDFEGLPVALLEAMACGVVPVVRNIRSGIPEVVRHQVTGLLTDEDPTNAARVLANLANDREGWERMSSCGRSLVSASYGDNVCYSKWRAVIAELADRGTATYPIRVRGRLRLPRFDKRLARLDHRKAGTLTRILRKIARAFRGGGHARAK